MIDEWILMETLGMGGYSKVKLGLHHQTAQKAALKIMFADHSGQMSESKTKQLLRELNVMKKVNHPNVIKLISFNANAQYPEASGKSTRCIMTALEFAAGGELFDYLMYTGHFDDTATRSYFKQLLDGLQAMHQMGIAHRDLKPENLLLDSRFTLKIADFGFATEFVDSQTGKMHLMKTPCGTKNYLAPEFWKGLKYSYKCDIFAAGNILFTTYARFPPFMEAQPKDWWWDKYSIAIEKLKRANELRQAMKVNPELKVEDSPAMKEKNACLNDAKKRMQLFWRAHSKKRQFDDDDFKDIALNLIHPDPDQRMEIKQIMAHKWVAKGPWYNADQLRLYLTQRVRHVLQGRARKIRKLMMEKQGTVNYDKRVVKASDKDKENEHGNQQPMKGQYVHPKAIDPEMRQRMKEIDPDHVFSANAECLKEDAEFPSSLFQFMTNSSPPEIAVRLERACAKLGATININAEDNAISISTGFESFIDLPDGEGGFTQHSKKEEVHLSVKQFVVGDLPKDLDTKPLEDRDDDITYLVSFKRLRASHKAYEKIAKKLFQMPCLSLAMQLDDVVEDDKESSASKNGDDDEKSEQ